MPAGAARNAIDCALWDLEAKQAGKPVWQLAGFAMQPRAVHTMRTVSVDSVERMTSAAAELIGALAIKIKVDGGEDMERIAAVHEAVPKADLIVDANESWSAEQLVAWLPALSTLGVVVLEQPLRADDDAALEGLERAVPICADESFHDRRSFSRIERRYDMLNIKLDKTGGLTEALWCGQHIALDRAGLTACVGRGASRFGRTPTAGRRSRGSAARPEHRFAPTVVVNLGRPLATRSRLCAGWLDHPPRSSLSRS